MTAEPGYILRKFWLEDNVEECPLYHCQRCEHFFKDALGIQEEDLHGQQTAIVGIVCDDCKKKLAGEGVGPCS